MTKHSVAHVVILAYALAASGTTAAVACRSSGDPSHRTVPTCAPTQQQIVTLSTGDSARANDRSAKDGSEKTKEHSGEKEQEAPNIYSVVIALIWALAWVVTLGFARDVLIRLFPPPTKKSPPPKNPPTPPMSPPMPTTQTQGPI